MIPQNEMDLAKFSLRLEILITVMSGLTVIIALPFVVSSFILRDSGYIFGLVALAVITTQSVWFAQSNLIRRGAATTIKSQKAKLSNWLAPSSWLHLDLYSGPEIAYRRGIFNDPRLLLKGLAIGNNPGFIYVMRRQDGIYKIGYSVNTKKRLKQHKADYLMGFILVRRFVVPDAIAFEKLALSMTRQYEYTEQSRLELRQMTTDELDDFLANFTACCLEAICS